MAARLGPWELIDRFAIGGVAEIFRARDTRSGDVVVIKRIRQDMPHDPNLHTGFAREIQIAMRAQHKNLVRALEHGLYQNRDYAVLEYVDGQDLERVIDRLRHHRIQLPMVFSTWIVDEILDGMSFAHELTDHRGMRMGLVHRDLAPKNIFLRYDGQVRVADFGLSIATAHEGPVDVVVGTGGYLSPEQARNERLDARSDLYSIGLILFELVTGERAFDVGTKSPSEVLWMHQRGEMPPIPIEVPPRLRDVVVRATAPERDARYPDAASFRAALRSTEAPPDGHGAELGLATVVRRVFADEFRATRLSGNPLPFLSGDP